jgi:hypothetical protein
MVLLENFGPAFAEAASSRPFTVQFNWLNRNGFVLLLQRNVVRTMMLRIPKLRKENYPERAKNKGKQFLTAPEGLQRYPEVVSAETRGRQFRVLTFWVCFLQWGSFYTQS